MGGKMKEWTAEDLSNYISFFNENQREYVLKEIFESDLLKEYLNTVQGRLVLGKVVDSIRDYTMKIVSLSVGGFKKNAAEIEQAALQIDTAYKFMYSIASMVTKGEKHSKAIKKK